MILGIPTLARYDLLDRLLASVVAGDELPSLYVIVDNGVGYTKERVRKFIGPDARLMYVPMKTNIGVAASWNLILDCSGGEAIISNDDVVFGRSTFRAMSDALRSGSLFVSVDGWALFGQRQECTMLVGRYDENFWPAYYEDVDYAVRLKKAGIDITPISQEGYGHEGWATTRVHGDAAWLKEGRYRNMLYLISKWGDADWSMVGGAHLYKEPFNGNAPPGWMLCKRGKPIPTRIDILNRIAKKIGAETYLEIGVAGGDSIRGVSVGEKWGVDPELSISDSDLRLFKMKSDEFFNTFGKVAKFDLIFIDGDHYADAVYADIVRFSRMISLGGVVVVHDCNPHLESLQAVPNPTPGWSWTGDGWKTIVKLRSRGAAIDVVDADYGVGIIYPRLTDKHFYAPVELGWRDLVSDRRRLLGLVDWWAWEKRLDERLADPVGAEPVASDEP